MACLGLGLYLSHLGVNGWDGPKVSGTGWRDNDIVVRVNLEKQQQQCVGDVDQEINKF